MVIIMGMFKENTASLSNEGLPLSFGKFRGKEDSFLVKLCEGLCDLK